MPDMNRQEMLENDVFNPAFTKGFAMWSRHGDVEVTEWPEPLPDDTFVPARTWLGNAAALAPGGNGSRSADQTNVRYWREIEGDFRATRMAAKGRKAPMW